MYLKHRLIAAHGLGYKAAFYEKNRFIISLRFFSSYH